MTKIALIDLFSGIGGFAEGFRHAGLEFKYHAFSEVAPGPISIYKKHFPEAEELGDVTTIRDFSRIKNQRGGVPLVVTFGFPCQDLSIAGKRRGLEGKRSGVVFEAIRVIRELRPDVFIFENVKGLLTSHGGADFIRCLQEIADLGNYDCQWQLVNTSWFLPQNRERVYFVGCAGAFSGRQIFPLRNSNKKADVVSNEQALCITATYGDNVGNGSYIVESERIQKVWQINRTAKNHQQDRVYSAEGLCPSLNTIPGGGHEPKIVIPVLTPDRIEKRQNGRRFKNDGDPSFTLTAQDRHGVLIVPENTKKGFIEVLPGQGVDLTQMGSKTRRGRLMDKNCNTLTAQSCQYAWWNGRYIRKLTPLECERLQGFPDGWTQYGNTGKKMSDSVRYKALGNAVSVPIPEAIARALFN